MKSRSKSKDKQEQSIPVPVPQDQSVTGPILKGLMERAKTGPIPSVGSKPIEPANLYQDAGQGYNQNLTDPQD